MKINIDKNLIATYMSLNNKKADEYLADLANEINKQIINSSNYDEISECLYLLEEFVYKVPKQIINIFEYILKTNYPVIKSRSKFGIFDGKTRTDVILKGLDLLSNIRYILPNEVLPILEKVIAGEEKAIREKALEILKKFSKYDYNVLFKSKIGYRAQRTALDYIQKWSVKKCLSNIDFVLTVVKELLNSTVEGSSWTDEKTLAMHFAQIDPTYFLKKMRKDTMDFINSLYSKTPDPKIRLSLSSVLEEVMRGPTNIAYSDAVKKMMDDDAKYLAGIYRKMIFDKSGNVVRENIAVAEEVEERLYFFAKPEKGRPDELVKLRDDILSDPFYEKVYPIIAGRTAYKSEEGYEKSRALRSKAVQDLVAQISDETLDEWNGILNILADQKNVIEEWKLGELKQFIEKFSSEKPEIADTFLGEAFRKNTNLIFFSENFLVGFRKAGKFDLWDKYVALISKRKSAHLAGGICISLISNEGKASLNKLRPNELSVLNEIVYKKLRFKFLKKSKDDEFEGYLHNAIFNALASRYKEHKKTIEKLIEEEIESNSKYNYIHYSSLQFAATGDKRIDLSIASKSFKAYLLKKIIEAPNLDWHLQEFILELCGKKFSCVIKVFKDRIDRYVKIQKKDRTRGLKRFAKRKEFEAIPHHFNPDLQKFIIDNKEFSRVLGSWVRGMTLGWSNYNWEISRFLESIKADKKNVLSEIVSKGDEKDLLRVAYAIESISKADFDLCMQIVGRTDKKRIHSKIEAIMYATGVVSGEFGIAEAYEAKAEILKKYLDNKNSRIKKFASEMTMNLMERADTERKRAAEGIQLRKIKFEG